MPKITRSDYIKYSRVLVSKLYDAGCWGAGSMYEENLMSAMRDKYLAKQVLSALVKQRIICAKKKLYGAKYYLNSERRDKIREIVKEQGPCSIIPILLFL